MSKPTTLPGKVHAEKIFRGGTILTMNDDRPQVEAIAIAGGRILAVGDEAEVMKTYIKSTEITDLGETTLMPSFIDAHGHFMNAPQSLDWANVSGVPVGPVTCIADIIKVLKDHVTKYNIKPGDDNWIIAYGYDINSLSEGRELTREDLKTDFDKNPVMLIHSSNHGAVLNSKAFNHEIVGYDETTPDPEGGFIKRVPPPPAWPKKSDFYGIPEGLIMEMAFLPVFGQMPQPTETQLLGKLDDAQQIYASVGVTTCQEGATHAKDLKFLRTAAEQHRFYLDIVSLPMGLDLPNFVHEYFPRRDKMSITTIPDEAVESFGTYNNRLKLAGIKIIVDGSPQGKTAFWTEPLLTGSATDPNDENWRGESVIEPELLDYMVKDIYDKGIQIFSHCNGDAAIDMMIEAARKAGIKAEDDRRTVIIHSQCMRRETTNKKDPTQLDSYVQLGFSPSFFTAHTFFWGAAHIENLGNHRASFLSPMKSAIEKGLRCSNHNDFSVTPMDPMRMVWSAVARESRNVDGITYILGKEERITPWQALKALTIEAAWQIREEETKGTLDVGKLADLVILDRNPLTVPTDDILKIQVLKTFKEGNQVYPRPVTLPGSLQ